MRGLLIFLSGIMLLFSCGGQQQAARLIEPQKMEAVLWDMFLADAFTNSFLKKDTTHAELVQNAALQKKIFELHKISKEDFYFSYHYYSERPAEMSVMLDSISTKAERERNNLMMERYSGSKAEKY